MCTNTTFLPFNIHMNLKTNFTFHPSQSNCLLIKVCTKFSLSVFSPLRKVELHWLQPLLCKHAWSFYQSLLYASYLLPQWLCCLPCSKRAKTDLSPNAPTQCRISLPAPRCPRLPFSVMQTSKHQVMQHQYWWGKALL